MFSLNLFAQETKVHDYDFEVEEVCPTDIYESDDELSGVDVLLIYQKRQKRVMKATMGFYNNFAYYRDPVSCESKDRVLGLLEDTQIFLRGTTAFCAVTGLAVPQMRIASAISGLLTFGNSWLIHEIKDVKCKSSGIQNLNSKEELQLMEKMCFSLGRSFDSKTGKCEL
jgi:hypothetical protein